MAIFDFSRPVKKIVDKTKTGVNMVKGFLDRVVPPPTGPPGGGSPKF